MWLCEGLSVCSSQASLRSSTKNLIRWWSDAVELSSCHCLNKRAKCQQVTRKRRRSLIQPNVGEKFAKRSESEECDRRHASLKWVHLAGIISLELQNIFLYSSASKSQRNNIFQHNLKWCWRKKDDVAKKQRMSVIVLYCSCSHGLLNYQPEPPFCSVNGRQYGLYLT